MNASRRDVIEEMNGVGVSLNSRMIGESDAIIELRRAIAKVAAARAPVLITGETGTGKELAARLIHGQSDRRDGPFIAVNCAALPAGLFQSEVFGYEKGAFTGAYRRNVGRIEAAQGGTLFLDEIGDLALDMQVVLLRFLQEGTFERLGSVEPVRADVRIVAATHADLEKGCREGIFREDLFYRLNALHLSAPPLRERDGDILRLARHFLSDIATRLKSPCRSFSAAALERLKSYQWPGNIRELRNCIRQAVVMCDGERIEVSDLGLPEPVDGDGGTNGSVQCRSLRQWRMAAERKAIQMAMSEANGQVQAAAELLRISRAQMYRLIDRHRGEIDLH